MTYCQLSNGKSYDFADPKIESIDIEVIAKSLSRLCRYNGHCNQHYSVLTHSMLVCDLSASDYKLEALLHDAAEAYVGDLVHPLKEIIPQFKEEEQKCHDLIAKKFGIPSKMSHIIKEADLHACYLEAPALLSGGVINNWHLDFKSNFFNKDIHIDHYLRYDNEPGKLIDEFLIQFARHVK